MTRTKQWMLYFCLVGLMAAVAVAFSGCDSNDDEAPTGDTNAHAGTDAGTDVPSNNGSDTGKPDDNGGDTNSDSGGADCTAPDAAQCGGNWGVFDSASCKCWEIPGSLETFTWDEAMTHCETLTLGGHGDWVLASRYDYQDMLGGCESYVLEGAGGDCQPCEFNIDCQRIFTSVDVLYWTESATERNAFYVQPEEGFVWVGGQTNRISARCVRAVN
ncbi:MAG: hypothetical protein GX146_08835 [Myxococcales bacterium]|jgi:hypothetical protein|nr:hypothetical protein [Myxococcales bacterium]